MPRVPTYPAISEPSHFLLAPPLLGKLNAGIGGLAMLMFIPLTVSPIFPFLVTLLIHMLLMGAHARDPLFQRSMQARLENVAFGAEQTYHRP